MLLSLCSGAVLLWQPLQDGSISSSGSEPPPCSPPQSQLPQSSPDITVPDRSQAAVASFRSHSELILSVVQKVRCKPTSYTELGLQMLGGTSQLEDTFPHHKSTLLEGGSCTLKRDQNWVQVKGITELNTLLKRAPSSGSLHTHCPWKAPH